MTATAHMFEDEHGDEIVLTQDMVYEVIHTYVMADDPEDPELPQPGGFLFTHIVKLRRHQLIAHTDTRQIEYVDIEDPTGDRQMTPPITEELIAEAMRDREPER